MLIDILNLWNELLIVGAILYAIAWLFMGLTYVATHTKHVIIGAILALITIFFSQISTIIIKLSVFLAIARLILNFI